MKLLKNILNGHEDITYNELKALSKSYDYRVFPKVRLADVFPIENSGIENALYGFSLKSHFDFLISNESNYPLFAGEFDGPTHRSSEQKTRDAKKNEICGIFDLPILRINANHLIKKYNKMSLLHLIISAWELKKAFDDAQEQGLIPDDEDFDPVHLFHEGSTLEEIHPHWLGLQPRLEFKRLHIEGVLPVRFSSGVVFYDNEMNYHGVEWIDVAEDKVIFIRSAMRRQQFPLYFGDLFPEILTVLLYDKLCTYLKSGKGSVDATIVGDNLQSMKQRHRLMRAHSAPTCVRFSINGEDFRPS